MKNAFYFTQKALFVLKIFKFLSGLFDHAAKRLDSKPGQQTFAILILPNISRSKGNQQARNQEVFRAGEFCSNQGISINIHLQREKERPRREKNLPFSRQEAPKNFILNEKFYPQITTIRAFFLQIRALFSSFRNRAGETSPPHPLQLRA